MITLQDIMLASERIKGKIHHTPLDYSTTFSNKKGFPVFLKLENLQKTGSFKLRGAVNSIATLTSEDRERGVIAASAGNHAQGVAYAAQLMGCKATIVMPEGAPISKVAATKGYGAEIILSGQSYDEAYDRALEEEQKTGATFIHAFNDYRIIAGQGTLALEVLEDCPDVENIVVPIGGGGLLAGIALAVKTIKPQVRLVGVQATGASAMYLSKQKGKLQSISHVDTIADGIAVGRPGDLTFEIIKDKVDDIVTVTDEEISQAILLLLERSKTVVEGAGAAGLAAVLSTKVSLPAGKTVVVLSGGNIDMTMVSHLIERGLIKAGRYVKIQTVLPDKPGNLQRLLGIIAETRANVISINHQRAKSTIAINQAEVEITLETRDEQHIRALLALLTNAGYISTIID